LWKKKKEHVGLTTLIDSRWDCIRVCRVDIRHSIIFLYYQIRISQCMGTRELNYLVETVTFAHSISMARLFELLCAHLQTDFVTEILTDDVDRGKRICIFRLYLYDPDLECYVGLKYDLAHGYCLLFTVYCLLFTKIARWENSEAMKREMRYEK